ncbi:hypothetical protein [Cyanobacterium sp. Dongsha4]|uniref:hypothetical protein n=1 Tax=Cyanobacterium sp. DS4 TaxID=2878255 RepID=UPI002E8061E2|nr:hypothetical protein [Cyanobacterium sp. Dongsha4]WVK99432.1 hypothetical protein Dongsha4_12150 [Cyanobacterium sp. Dongsha4]
MWRCDRVLWGRCDRVFVEVRSGFCGGCDRALWGVRSGFCRGAIGFLRRVRAA